MSETNQYGSRDASARYQKIRGQVRWISKKKDIQTTRSGGSGSFSSPSSNRIDASFIGNTYTGCESCIFYDPNPPNDPENVRGQRAVAVRLR